MSPRGGIVICEDGGGSNPCRGLTADGAIFDMEQDILDQDGI